MTYEIIDGKIEISCNIDFKNRIFVIYTNQCKQNIQSILNYLHKKYGINVKEILEKYK